MLSFVYFYNNNVSVIPYNIPQNVAEIIKQNLNLNSENKSFILSFGRYIEFQPNHHLPLLDFLFNVLYKHDVLLPHMIPHYSLDDHIFICAICHHLDFKKGLVFLIPYILQSFNVSFNELKEKSKSDKYRMTIYTK